MESKFVTIIYVLGPYKIFVFTPWCLFLVLAKFVHIKIGLYNIHFSPYFIYTEV